MTETLGDYPIAPIDGIEPVFARQMLLQAMATVYAKATGRSVEDMMSDAVATWDTEWDSDPEPRTIEHAVEAAQSDLQHWDD